MIELLFILGFSLHNIEEAIWLPKWSKYAKKYHKEVTENEFRFAVIIITAIGYLITFQYLLFPFSVYTKYIYLGFVVMMVFNVIFPHLLASIILKKYAPGTITGIMLNAPIGLYILIKSISDFNELFYIMLCGLLLALMTLLVIKLLFKIGKKLFD
jgi:hypothetical protein